MFGLILSCDRSCNQFTDIAPFRKMNLFTTETQRKISANMGIIRVQMGTPKGAVVLHTTTSAVADDFVITLSLELRCRWRTPCSTSVITLSVVNDSQKKDLVCEQLQ